MYGRKKESLQFPRGIPNYFLYTLENCYGEIIAEDEEKVKEKMEEFSRKWSLTKGNLTDFR